MTTRHEPGADAVRASTEVSRSVHGRAGFAAAIPGGDQDVVDLAAPAGGAWRWPLAEATRDKRIVVVDDLTAYPAPLPPSPWSEAPRAAIVLPLASPDQ